MISSWKPRINPLNENPEDIHQYSEINEPSSPLLIDQYQIDLNETEKVMTHPSISQPYTKVSTAISTP